jgi:diacylglycerol kinase (ATP)
LNPTASHPDPQARIVGLISNPNSRRNRAGLHKVQGIVANQPRIHHRVTAGAGEIAGVLREFARLGVNTLAINGGDGTGARVLTELLEQRPFAQVPAIILLPGGTTNMNAADAGLRGSLPDSVRRVADWANGNAAHSERLTRPVLRVEGARGEQALYGMFFGTGTIVSGIKYCHANIHTLGIRDELAPGLVVLRTLWGMIRKDTHFSRPTAIDIGLDDTEYGEARPVVQLLVTSLQRLFLGLRPWWGKEPGDLHCTWMEHPSRRVLRAFPALLRGRPNHHVNTANGYFSHNAETIRLRLDGTFTLDGEMHQASREHGPLTITNGRTLEFVRIRR